MLCETLELFSRTVQENEYLAGLVQEIHTGTIGGEPHEAGHLAQILEVVPNLRVFELRGWSTGAENSVISIFATLRRNHRLRTLILSPTRLLGYSSPALCDAEDLFSILCQLRGLETIDIDPSTCSSREDHRDPDHALYPTPDSSLTHIPSHFLTTLQQLRWRRENIVQASPLLVFGFRFDFTKDACPNLRRVKLIRGLSSEFELYMLSTCAPNITEIDVRTICTHLFEEQSPQTFIAPALRVWSEQLVKLILPEFRSALVIGPSDHMEHWMRRFPYNKDDTIADIIVQMPRLRILGISRGSMEPKHFARGPESLVSLNYYFSSSKLCNPTENFLPDLVTVLNSENTLSQLRHLCLSLEKRYLNTDTLDGILERRNVEYFYTEAKWEAAANELNVSDSKVSLRCSVIF